MKEHYMAQIWSLNASTVLTIAEKQKAIINILAEFEAQVQDFTKIQFKKQCINTITESLNKVN